jgi:Na+/proline symporter
MRRPYRARTGLASERAVALFLLAVLAFSPFVLSIFNVRDRASGHDCGGRRGPRRPGRRRPTSGARARAHNPRRVIMLDGWFILFVSFAYLCLLFAIAYYGDKRADAGRSLIANPYIYALSIAVYCTSWTYYGSVGRAASSGIGFLPIYIGPTLTFVLWWFVLRKIIRISKAHRITSIADFISSRYGKSARLSGLVTVIAVVGIMPYISLQLKAVSASFNILLLYPAVVTPTVSGSVPLLGDTAFLVALALAAFAILFGTRHIDASEHHEGMVAAIAFESIVKLLAFLAVGIFVTFSLYDVHGGDHLPAPAVPGDRG